MPKNFAKPFLITLVIITLFACYLVFKPFLTEIIIAAILATIFYRPYDRLAKALKGRRNLASLLMCLFLLAVIIIPTVNIMIYAGGKSMEAYSNANRYFADHNINDALNNPVLQKFGLNNQSWFNSNDDVFQNVLMDFFKKSSDWLISGATSLVVGTTSFVLSLVMIVIAMFFFFVDGKRMLEYLMYLSPLPNKYDQEIFRKFREVSYTTMISTFVVAIAQGVVGAIGFAVIGFPAFLAGVLVGLLSLFPYLGAMIFYIPAGLYYLLIGKLWQGIFILLWGFLIIGTIDNVIRAWMIKGKAKINPIFVVFSVLGGIALFGFWGVVLGPLIVSIAATILHIYALEFCEELDSSADSEGTLLEGEEGIKRRKKD